MPRALQEPASSPAERPGIRAFWPWVRRLQPQNEIWVGGSLASQPAYVGPKHFPQLPQMPGAARVLPALLRKPRCLTEQIGGIDPALNVAFPLPPAIAGLIPAQHEKHVLTCWPGDLPAKRFKSSPGAQIRQGDSFLLGNAAHTQHQT